MPHFPAWTRTLPEQRGGMARDGAGYVARPVRGGREGDGSAGIFVFAEAFLAGPRLGESSSLLAVMSRVKDHRLGVCPALIADGARLPGVRAGQLS